ncbi:MAG: cyclic nucleotide-binding protein [Chloroflexi bacterium OLB14]|nr:MAG: cyclic nucleotide-binding protein [Chloroflexi bacterium OLB14]
MDPTISLRIPLFKSLSKLDLFKLVNELPMYKFKQGEFLFREGEHGDSLFILMEGKLEIVLGADTKDEMILNTCTSGQCVGEMSLIMPEGTRTASARLKENSIVRVMTREKFNELLKQHPQIAYSMVEIMSERLDSSNETSFNDLVAKNHALQKAYDELKAAQAQIIEKDASNVNCKLLPIFNLVFCLMFCPTQKNLVLVQKFYLLVKWAVIL